MTAQATEREQQAIEAACKAIEEHFRLMGYDSYRMAIAAISAYLAASGVGRDAERYRWLRDCWWLDDDAEMTPDPMITCETAEQFDAAIDAAMAREGE